ncbi:MAG: hypothetical protein ABI041_06545 [Bdellovibrionia bacterium]
MTDENNSGNKNNPDSKEKSMIFTVGTEEKTDGDMPSVTRLLNRKSLNLNTPSKPAIPAKPSFVAPEPIAAPLPPPVASVPLKVKTIVRKQSTSVTPLSIWEKAQLKGGTDPLGKGIAQLMEKGATCAVFLKIAPPSPESKVPQFVGTAAVLPGKRLAIWTGLRWDPNKSPDAWNQLLKSGVIEFPPPGNHTQLDSQRNAIRGALGVESEEWLLLVRVGPANACRGITVFLSEKSLLLQVKSVLSLLQEPLKK